MTDLTREKFLSDVEYRYPLTNAGWVAGWIFDHYVVECKPIEVGCRVKTGDGKVGWVAGVEEGWAWVRFNSAHPGDLFGLKWLTPQ
jgi:hypothetical protein